MKKNVVWILPRPEKGPVGGYKVVYEYANMLVADGYNISIVYTLFTKKGIYDNLHLKPLRWLYSLIIYSYLKITNHSCRPKWFALNQKVQCEYVFRLNNSKALEIPDAKFLATALETSFDLADVESIPKANKFYFIQGFENWSIPDEQVYDSYRLPLNKIVIAPYLKQCVEKAGERAVLVENGFDFDYFKMSTPIEARKSYEIAMLYHLAELKRCNDSIAALKIVKKQVPQLHVTMFGVPSSPNVPEWFSYFQKPNKEEHNMIYNNAAIFVSASKTEGMALPPAESMICGCALVCTDIPGFAVYAKNNETALMSPVYDVEALANNILNLIRNNDLRVNLAKNGNKFIQQFTWKRAYNKFVEVLEKYDVVIVGRGGGYKRLVFPYNPYTNISKCSPLIARRAA